MAARLTVVKWLGRTAAAGAVLVGVDVVVAAARAATAPGTRVVERGTGRPVREPRPFGEHARILLVWTTVTGSRVLCRTAWFLRYLERVTVKYGNDMDQPASASRIDEFIADYDVDVSVLDRGAHEFSTVNELFSRPLRAGARTIERPDDPSVAVCPADGRLTCVDGTGDVADLYIKGRYHDVSRLIGVTGERRGAGSDGVARVRAFYDAASADGFSAAVCRLAPGDYHRFHWPVDGVWRRADVLDLPGEYHSVAAPCISGPVDVLGRNRRAVSVIRTDVFGDVAIVVVGAVKVGSIELTATSGTVRKGAEMGMFKYGGSTIVVVFRRGSIDFDTELADNSARGSETLVRVGSVLGHATRSGNGS